MTASNSSRDDSLAPCFAAGRIALEIGGCVAMHDAQSAAHAADGAARAGGGASLVVADGLADTLRMAAGLVTAKGDRLPVIAVAAIDGSDADAAMPALTIASRTLVDLRAGGDLNSVAEALVSASPVVVVCQDPGSAVAAVDELMRTLAGWSHSASVERFAAAAVGDRDGLLAPLREARRPVILVGRGAAVGSDADVIAKLARTWHAPVCLTYSATGMPAASLERFLAAFSADLPILPAGTAPWSTALARADRILALGSGLAETDWFGLSEARLVRAPVTRVALAPDADGAAESTIDAEAGAFAVALTDELERGGVLAREDWSERFVEARATWTELADQEAERAVGEERLAAGLAAREIVSAAPADTVFVGEGGASGMWLASYAWLRPLVLPAQHASIGASIAMAAGVAEAEPDRPVWAVVGDGAFFYCARELAGLAERGVPVVVFVFNDRSWNAIRLVQTLFFRRKTVGTDLPSVDYGALAEMHGCEHVRARTAGELALALSMAQEPRTGPLVVDVTVEKGAIPFIGANLILAEVDGVLKTLAGSVAASSAIAATKDRPALLANLRVIAGAVRK